MLWLTYRYWKNVTAIVRNLIGSHFMPKPFVTKEGGKQAASELYL